MPLVTELDLPMFNVFDADVIDTFHERIQGVLGDGGWIVQTPMWYSVVEHDAVRELQKDSRLRTLGTGLLEMQGVTEGRLYDGTERVILSLEGEEHSRIRRLVSRAFTPRAVDRLRPTMRAYVEKRANAIAASGSCDFMADLAEAFPIAVICELVGAPKDDWPRFSRWADSIFKQFNFNLAADLAEIERAGEEMEQYIESLIEARRSSPGDDLLSELIVIEEDGDALTHQELADLVSALLLAGTDTTRNQLGLAMMLFAEHPDEWARLVADPSLAHRAVEEVLRYQPTAAGTPRVAIADIEYRGVTIPEGTMITLLSMSANRDPKAVTCPMDFDVTADRGSWQSLTFGGGPHYCLGANLARAELQEAIEILARTWRTVSINGEPVMKPLVGLYGPVSLPLKVEPV